MSGSTRQSSGLESPGSDPMYYVTDHAKASFSEILRMAKGAVKINPVAMIGIAVILCHKLVGRSFRHGPPFLLDERREFIDATGIPPNVRAKLEPFIKPLIDAGFTQILACRHIESQTASYTLVMEHFDHLQIASVAFVESLHTEMQFERTVTSIASKRSDETTLSTTNMRRGIDFPPEMKIEFLTGASVAQLIDAHRRRISDITDIVVIRPDDLISKPEEMDKFTEFQVKRGYFVPATDAEISAAQRNNI